MGSSPNSSTTSSPSVELHPRRSPSAAVAVISFHLFAALALFEPPLPGWAVAGGLALVALSLWRILRRSPPARLHHGGDTWLLSWAGAEAECRLRRWFCHPWLCVLCFEDGGGRRHVVVLPGDALGREQHRRLRVLLRLRGADQLRKDG